MQLAALEYLRKLAADHPESSVRLVTLTDVFGGGTGIKASDNSPTAVWYNGRVPEFEVLNEGGENGQEARVRFGSVVLTPAVFLLWLQRRLLERGVKFERVGEVKALGELAYLGHDVLVNASGQASGVLEDVKDEKVITDRTYVAVVKSEFQQAFVHRGAGVYTYVFGRGDGTAVVGGVSEPTANPVKSVEEVHDIVSRFQGWVRSCWLKLTYHSSSAMSMSICPSTFPLPRPLITRSSTTRWESAP
jgi:hypothetical protein